MSSTADTAAMAALMQARFRAGMTELQQVSAEESHLREELRRLADMEKGSQEALETAFGVRALGADSLWQKWIGQTRMSLNQRLANVMARKLEALDRARGHFGAMHAADALAGQKQARARDRRLAAQQTLVQEQITQLAWDQRNGG